MSNARNQDAIDYDRRRLLESTLLGFATAGAVTLFPKEAAAAGVISSIRPMEINFPEEDLIELRRRIRATRWPDKEQVFDSTQGVQLATMKKLADYWATKHNWRKIEARLNALPNFITEIDGVDIHFIHVRSHHPNALPMIVTHGWPGSVIEQL